MKANRKGKQFLNGTSEIKNPTYAEENYTLIISHSFYKCYINFYTQIKKMIRYIIV